jgi:hypothetical protein
MRPLEPLPNPRDEARDAAQRHNVREHNVSGPNVFRANVLIPSVCVPSVHERGIYAGGVPRSGHFMFEISQWKLLAFRSNDVSLTETKKYRRLSRKMTSSSEK